MATLEQDGAKSKYLRMGIWNVRSIRCKEEEAVREMKKYRLDILGVGEAHLRGCGERSRRCRDGVFRCHRRKSKGWCGGADFGKFEGMYIVNHAII